MRKILLSISILFLLSFSIHKYYVSITKIEIDTSSLQVKIHSGLFVDDFEKLLEERFELRNVDFEDATEEVKINVKQYVERKIKFKLNRKEIPLRYLGFELEDEYIYFYVEGKISTKKIGRVDVENTMLQEIFTEQNNKIDITYKNEVKSVNLSTNVPSGTIYF